MIPTPSPHGATVPHGAPGRVGPSRALRILGPAILLVSALIALLVALSTGGGAAPLPLQDPGAFVRWALPVAKLVTNLSAALMIGPLVLALFTLRPGERPFEQALNAASVGAALFTVAAATTVFLTFMSIFNPQLSAEREFGAQLGRFLFDLPLGQAWVIAVILGAIVTLLLFAWRTWTPVLLTTVLAMATLLPIATTGHSGDLSGHGLAVNSILLHMVAAAVWLGGLLLLVLLRGGGSDVDEPILRRYSSIALASFVVVAASGLARSFVALETWADLWTPYGAILIAKIALLTGLGAFGVWYRMRLIPRIGQSTASAWFWRLVAAELALMGLASGAAAALGRTPTPAGDEAPAVRTPAELLMGEPVPPELTPIRWITMWDVDVLWLLGGLFGIFFYLAAVWRLRRRGDSWPVHRTVLWIVGILVLIWVTSGSINLYQDFLFSVHMLGHMLLGMGIPLLLVGAAPITLALRAIRKRDDGTRGGREWILWAVHSPWSRIVTHPIVAAAIFILSLWAFYFTDLFRWAMYDHLGHQWMIIHFLISGYLFTMSLIGSDPVPYRLPYAGRLVTLITTMAMHAFFGVALMMQNGLMVAEWFGATGRTWGATPMEDQYVGGGIAWSIGEIPTLILAVTVAILWSRDDTKVSRRRDRHADRTGEAELEEYNAQLAKLAERDRRAAEREAQRSR